MSKFPHCPIIACKNNACDVAGQCLSQTARAQKPLDARVYPPDVYLDIRVRVPHGAENFRVYCSSGKLEMQPDILGVYPAIDRPPFGPFDHVREDGTIRRVPDLPEHDNDIRELHTRLRGALDRIDALESSQAGYLQMQSAEALRRIERLEVGLTGVGGVRDLVNRQREQIEDLAKRIEDVAVTAGDVNAIRDGLTSAHARITATSHNQLHRVEEVEKRLDDIDKCIDGITDIGLPQVRRAKLLKVGVTSCSKKEDPE